MASSQLSSPASPRQKAAISRLLRALGVCQEWEQQEMSQAEAGQMIGKLERQLKLVRMGRTKRKEAKANEVGIQ